MKLIAAVDRRWAIGRGEELLFAIPEDLARFKALTLGHAIVCGRKTLATFPGGAPLPGRRNYVLTHDPGSLPPGAYGVDSIPALLDALKGEESVFLAGGGSLYAALLPYCTRAYVTKVEADGRGDRFCPDLDSAPDWRLTEASDWKRWNGLCYRFCLYERIAV